jgi:hypothetical protein
MSEHDPNALQDMPVCPHCGYVNKDPNEIDFGGMDGDAETYCGECGEPMLVSRVVFVSYKTMRIK